MVQAAASGAFNFAEFDYASLAHWRRLRLILNELDRQNELALVQGRLDHARWQLSRIADPSALGEALDRLHNLLHEWWHGYYPEQKRLSDVDVKKQRTRSDVDEWEAKFGKLSDPATQQKLEEFAAGFEALIDATARTSAARLQAGVRTREHALVHGRRL